MQVIFVSEPMDRSSIGLPYRTADGDPRGGSARLVGNLRVKELTPGRDQPTPAQQTLRGGGSGFHERVHVESVDSAQHSNAFAGGFASR